MVFEVSSICNFEIMYAKQLPWFGELNITRMVHFAMLIFLDKAFIH
jgi:hypothetical protein